MTVPAAQTSPTITWDESGRSAHIDFVSRCARTAGATALLSALMHEYVTVSSSSYDPASLASKLTEKSGDGWDVVSIVQTGGDVTAFLRRARDTADADAAVPSEAAEIESAVSEPEPEAAVEPEPVSEPEPVVEPEPAVVAAAAPIVDAVPEAEPVTSEPEPETVSEPAGWAAASSTEPAGWAASTETSTTSEPAADAAAAAAAAATVAEGSTVYSPDPTPAAATYTPEPVTAIQETVAPQPAVPAGWYADPSGRYELRYWDGTQWTEHVARGGQQYTDQPVA